MGQGLGRLGALIKGVAAAGTEEEVGFQFAGAMGAGHQLGGWFLVRVMIHFLPQVATAKRAKEGIRLQLPPARGANGQGWLQVIHQWSILFLAPAAMGAEGEPLLHFQGAMDAVKILWKGGGRRQGRIQDLLVLLGEIGAGLAQAGHPSADLLGDLRESLRPEEDQGQNQEENELFEGNADHGPPLTIKLLSHGRNGGRRRTPGSAPFGI
jgi:hypothetical protein